MPKKEVKVKDSKIHVQEFPLWCKLHIIKKEKDKVQVRNLF